MNVVLASPPEMLFICRDKLILCSSVGAQKILSVHRMNELELAQKELDDIDSLFANSERSIVDFDRILMMKTKLRMILQ